MELGYKNWLIIKEMSGVIANLDDVVLKKSPGGFIYDFISGGRSYRVEFSGPHKWTGWTEGNPLIAERMFSVEFSYDDGAMGVLGDTESPMTVFSQVFKAVRKLIEQQQADALSFYGAYHEQDVMYDLFYNKYLYKAFTRVGSERYVRNDLYNKLKQEGGAAWLELAQREDDGKGVRDARIQKGIAARNKARKLRVQPTQNWQDFSGLPQQDLQNLQPSTLQQIIRQQQQILQQQQRREIRPSV